jgi:transposase-like protein
LIVYRDSQIKFTQLYRISDGEHYVEIKEDLENLLKIKSITCDGHKATLKAIKHSCKEVIVQRCLVHIQRECRLWLTAHPKTKEGLALLQIVHQLHLIESQTQYQDWLKTVL